jgi:hypothetical protein
VHEPDRRGRAGQRLQQPHAPVHRQVVHDHQVDAPRLQVRALYRAAGYPACEAPSLLARSNGTP